MRFPRRFVVLLALGGGACAVAGTGTPVDPAVAEREVLMMIIAKHGRASVLIDSTWAPGCAQNRTGVCANPPGVAPETWESYLRTSGSRAALRDLLPGDAQVTYASEVGDESSLPCESRRHKLQLSRVGISPDGNAAIVNYTRWIPMDHFGCGAVRGALMLLRRAAEGGWQEDRPLSITVS